MGQRHRLRKKKRRGPQPNESLLKEKTGSTGGEIKRKRTAAGLTEWRLFAGARSRKMGAYRPRGFDQANTDSRRELMPEEANGGTRCTKGKAGGGANWRTNNEPGKGSQRSNSSWVNSLRKYKKEGEVWNQEWGWGTKTRAVKCGGGKNAESGLKLKCGQKKKL